MMNKLFQCQYYTKIFGFEDIITAVQHIYFLSWVPNV